MTREPVLIISTIVTILVGAIATLLGNGFLSDAVAGRATDIVNIIGQLLILAAPLIAGIIARNQVTPVAAPAIPAGTTVTVVQPGSTPNTTATV